MTELRMITCEICGTAAPATTNRDTGSKRQKTCGSDACRRAIATRRKQRWRDKPQGQSKPIRHVNCAECRKLFVTRHPSQVVCSKACRRRRDNRLTTEWITRRYCEDPKYRDLVISQAQNRRASKLGVGNIASPAALIDYLMKRDHGRCGICRKPIRAKTGPRRPSIDHIIPLSCGGEHALENLQPAHYDCNLSKGNRGGGQVLLVG